MSSAAYILRKTLVLLVTMIGIPGIVSAAEFFCIQGKEVIVGLGDGVIMHTCMWEKEPGVTIRTGSLELVKNDILILKSQTSDSGKLHGDFTVWSDDGKIIEFGSYVEGVKEGPWLETDKNGISTTLVYRQGKIVDP